MSDLALLRKIIRKYGSSDKKRDTLLHIISSVCDQENSSKSCSSFHRLVRTALSEKKIPTAATVKLLKPLYEIYKELYPNIKTLSVKLSEVRKVIKENQSKEAYTKSTYREYFNIPLKDKEGIASDYKKSVEKKNKNREVIDKTMITEGIDRLMKDVIGYSTGKDEPLTRTVRFKPYNVGVLLMLASGMRPVELFTNEVERKPKEKNGDAQVYISNIAKKREKDKSLTMVRPLQLISSGTFMGLLGQFRKYFEGKKTLNAYGRLAADKLKSLDRAVKKYFTGITPSSLRKIYASMIYDEIGGDQNFNTFIKDILGHTSLDTSFSYSFLSIK